MATSSITKEFVINDDQTFDILMKVINERKTRKKKTLPGKYEEGQKILKQFFPPCKG